MDCLCDYCGNVLTEWDYMTECGHFICGTICYNKYENVCPICKKKCKFIRVGEKVPLRGTGYLKPMKNLIHDVENVVNFRLVALTHLVGFLKDKITKQRTILDHVKKELRQAKEYKWKLYQVNQENEYLKRQLLKINRDASSDFVDQD